MRPAEGVGPEGLRCLDGDERAPVEGRGDVAHPVDLGDRLDGVRHREARHRPVGTAVGHGVDDGLEHRGGGERARGVVHENDGGVLGDRGQAPAHRLGSSRAARHDDVGTVRAGLGAVPSAGTHQDDARRHRSARVDGPLEDGAATEERELLGPAEPAAGPARDDDGPHLGHGAPPRRGIRSGRRSDALRPSPRPR